jgi:hypothetical protein
MIDVNIVCDGVDYVMRSSGALCIPYTTKEIVVNKMTGAMIKINTKKGLIWIEPCQVKKH